MTPEGLVKRSIIDLLNAERIPFHRLNSGTVLVKRGDRKRAIRLAPAGTPDLLALMPGREHRQPVYIEVKAAKGRQSDAQIEFESEAEAWGVPYLLVRDASELQRWIKENVK